MNQPHTAVNAFIAAKFKIDALIERIAAASEDHFSVGPDDTTWGDVSMLNDAVERLTEITDALFQEGEHDPNAA